jgi:hypothetical protein
MSSFADAAGIGERVIILRAANEIVDGVVRRRLVRGPEALGLERLGREHLVPGRNPVVRARYLLL